MIDTHSHLTFDVFKDKNKVIERASEVGIKKIIVVGIDPFDSIDALKISKQNKNIFASIGIHPCNVGEFNFKDVKINAGSGFIAIGECGLDYYYDGDYELQKNIFIEHLDLALLLDLPVIVHVREAWDDAINIIKKYQGKIKGVMHCFSGTLEQAKTLVKMGFYLGISGVITYPKATNLVNIVQEIPLSYLLTETDCPYLTPVPFRGKQNEPVYIKYIVNEIAKIKNISFAEVSKITYQNALNLFNIKEQ